MSVTGISALRSAKEIFGSEAALALVVGVTQPTVHYTLNKAEKVPAEWCIPIHLATAKLAQPITCHQLRPDLWGPRFNPKSVEAA